MESYRAFWNLRFATRTCCHSNGFTRARPPLELDPFSPRSYLR
ncbi:unnamed protein product [Amoebophrya sp. A120]|nr:unnamed protein product [Amoebophrya sp. A120]|eukprot:GSA120T00011039001.1